MFSLSDRSLYVEALGLWIDSMRSRHRCYVSHGHSDHAREHARIVATPNTARICRERFRKDVQPVPSFEEHRFNEPWDDGSHRLTLFSAGHVLGSSQLLIEGEKGRFVYTGDFKLGESLTAESPEVKRCDVLLMECTYGRPHYAFPPREHIEMEMVAFAREAIESGAVPVFLAYSLGKAQEALAILGRSGLRITVHGAIHRMCRVYEECGVALPRYERYDAAGFQEGVLIWPPSRRRLPEAPFGKKLRTAVLTGWMLDPGVAVRYGAEHGFALSDHADYPSLLRYVELAQPRKVLLNHGRRDFVYRLRALGVDAEYLEEYEQLALF